MVTYINNQNEVIPCDVTTLKIFLSKHLGTQKYKQIFIYQNYIKKHKILHKNAFYSFK